MGAQVAEAEEIRPGRLNSTTAGPRHRWAGVRAVMRLAARDIRRNKGRSALIVALMMLPVGAASAGATLAQSTQPTPSEVVARELGAAQARYASGSLPGPGVRQTPDNDRNIQMTGPLAPQSDWKPRQATDVLPAGARVLRDTTASTEAWTTAAHHFVGVRGVDALDPVFAGKFRLTGGSAPSSASEALATPGFLGTVNASIGDTVSTGLGTFKVTGTIAQTGKSPDTPELFVAPSLVPEASSNRAGTRTEYYVAGAAPIAWDRVLELNKVGVTVLDRDLVLDPPPIAKSNLSPSDGRTLTIYATTALIGGLALLQVGLLAGAAFAVGARRQARELHVLAAAGADARDLRRVTLASALVLGAIAAVLGAALGLGGGAAGVAIAIANGSTAFSGVHPSVLVAIGAGVVGLVACLIAALAPARAAGREALRSAMGAPPAKRPSRRVAVAGAVVTVLAALALVGAGIVPGLLSPEVRDRLTGVFPFLAAGGAIAAVVGVVLLLPTLVQAVVRPLDAFSAPWRMALRDATRNRQRAVPAIAACIAVAALAIAVMMPSAGNEERNARTYSWLANVNQVTSWVRDKGPALEDIVAAAQIAGGDPTAARTISQPVVAGCGPAGEHDDAASAAYVQAFGRQGPCERPGLAIASAHLCPRTESGAIVDRSDVRCTEPNGDQPRALVVGDAEDLALILQRQPSREAVQTLETGGAVVLDEAVFDGGRSELGASKVAAPVQSGRPQVFESRATLKAVLEPARFNAAGVISPATARSYGILARPYLHLVQLAAAPSADFDARIMDELSAKTGMPGYARVERGPDLTTAGLLLWLVVGGAALVALAGASITTGLALADGRRDSMTLAELGAAPGFRRRYAAAQAGVTVGLGTLLGGAIGLGAGIALVGSFAGRVPLVVPWAQLAGLVVVIPVLAAALAWCLTRAGHGERRRTIES